MGYLSDLHQGCGCCSSFTLFFLEGQRWHDDVHRDWWLTDHVLSRRGRSNAWSDPHLVRIKLGRRVDQSRQRVSRFGRRCTAIASRFARVRGTNFRVQRVRAWRGSHDQAHHQLSAGSADPNLDGADWGYLHPARHRHRRCPQSPGWKLNGGTRTLAAKTGGHVDAGNAGLGDFTPKMLKGPTARPLLRLREVSPEKEARCDPAPRNLRTREKSQSNQAPHRVQFCVPAGRPARTSHYSPTVCGKM